MKQVKVQLWTSLGEHGQKSRPCHVHYSVNGLGAKTLYHVAFIYDARNGDEYDVDKTLALNDNMDERIAAADPVQVAFAKKELGVDLKKPRKCAPGKPAKPKKPEKHQTKFTFEP